MSELKFLCPSEEDRESILHLTRDNIRGTDIFTFCSISSFFEEGLIWCGKNSRGEIKSLIYDKRSALGENPFGQEKEVLMIYKGGKKQGRADIIEGRDIISLYKLLSSEKKLSPDNEKRYVYRVKCVNRGFARVFGIWENDALLSSASVTSENGKYALIGDVFTLEEKRKRGLARECIFSAVDWILEKNKTPVLLCKKEMCPYYEKAGFTEYENV